MKKFLLKIIVAASLLFASIIILSLLPATPRASKSLLFSQIYKDNLMKETASPRMIFVGGSNISFGINSQIIKDSLGINPINTGIHAGFGLIYMMDHCLPHIRAGDIVIVSPEYEQFYGTNSFGSEYLLRVVMNVPDSGLSELRAKQWQAIIKYFPVHAFSKLKPTEYFFNESDIYGVNSFNQYGDMDAHWGLEKRKFKPTTEMPEQFTDSLIDELRNFENILTEKGAVMFLTFPGLNSSSYTNIEQAIARVEEKLKEKGFLLLGTPQRYKMEESLMFNSPYHLSSKGMNHRTKLLIDDLRKHQQLLQEILPAL